jgi:hypothetical protein
MKLARPDLFHPRIVFAGCPQSVSGDDDDAGLVKALRKRGLHARWMSWDDPATLRADLVILRAPQDYRERIEEFLAWTSTVRHLLNAPDVVAWNADESYRRDLSRRGVPVATRAAAVGETEATALVFLGGRSSHAFTTSPKPAPAEPDFEIWDVGFAALEAAADKLDITPRDFLYARVDVVGGLDDPRLLEFDLVQPWLGWTLLDKRTRDLQQREFSRTVASILDRLGMGPLSHRRP